MNKWISLLLIPALLPVSGAAADTLRPHAPPSGSEAPDTLKIAVASTGSAADAAISLEAARAPYFLIFDQAGELMDVVENRDLPAQRAGAQVAQLLKERGVTHFIAGRFGQNLLNALRAAGIGRVEKTGTADEAVKQLLKGPGKE
jgi:predicted Fe-Mo cluster-binding NifX family protein